MSDKNKEAKTKEPTKQQLIEEINRLNEVITTLSEQLRAAKHSYESLRNHVSGKIGNPNNPNLR